MSENARTVSRPERIAVYAGVFDPPTLAHMAVIQQALGLFDKLVVVVAHNPSKSDTMFSAAERVQLVRDSLTEEMHGRVDVMAHAGLIAPLAGELGACALVRAMRPVTDPDYEIALALMNQKLAPAIPTVLLVARSDMVYLSSTFVRDVARLGHSIVPESVPAPVARALRERFPEHTRSDNGASELAREPGPGLVLKSDQ